MSQHFKVGMKNGDSVYWSPGMKPALAVEKDHERLVALDSEKGIEWLSESEMPELVAAAQEMAPARLMSMPDGMKEKLSGDVAVAGKAKAIISFRERMEEVEDGEES